MPIRHCIVGLAGREPRRRAHRALASGGVRPVPRPARRAATCGGCPPRRPPTRRARSPTPAIRGRWRSRAPRPRRRTGSRCSRTTSATGPAPSPASSRSRRTRRSAAATAGARRCRSSPTISPARCSARSGRSRGTTSTWCSSSRGRCRTRPGATVSTWCSTAMSTTNMSARRCAELRGLTRELRLFGSLRRGARAVSTLFRKIWDAHLVAEEAGEPSLLYVDLHLVHEVTSPQAFESLRLNGRPVRRPDLTVATMDHNVPTVDGPDHRRPRARAARRAAPRTARSSACACSRPAAAARGSCT